MSLQEFLVWIISGGGAGVVAYWIMEMIAKNVSIGSELKRYLSLVVAGLLAAGAYMASVFIGYEPKPEDVMAWIEAIFAVIALALGLSQIIHGRLKLGKRPANE